MVYIGAFATVLMLAFPVFTQQSVSIKLQAIPELHSAEITRSIIYQPNFDGNNVNYRTDSQGNSVAGASNERI
jgi:hypothetical protein